MMVKAFAIALAAAAMVIGEAEAKRLGGGGSVGRQSQSVTQRSATPPQAPAQNAAPSQAASQPAAAGAAGAAKPAATGSRWMAPLAGLAAGLGLAALASHFGFGEGLASLMLVLLLGVAAIVVVRMIMARRAPARPALATAYASSGVGSEASVRYAPMPDQARPAPAGSSFAPAAAPAAASNLQIPADFDVDGFLRNAKIQFVRLQAAFDSSDVNDLREFTSPEMFAELKMEIAERKGAANQTDVVQLDAELLGIESGLADHLASVRFHGLIRENDSGPTQPFDEVWNLSKPVSGGGWVLAGIQQLN